MLHTNAIANLAHSYISCCALVVSTRSVLIPTMAGPSEHVCPNSMVDTLPRQPTRDVRHLLYRLEYLSNCASIKKINFDANIGMCVPDREKQCFGRDEHIHIRYERVRWSSHLVTWACVPKINRNGSYVYTPRRGLLRQIRSRLLSR